MKNRMREQRILDSKTFFTRSYETKDPMGNKHVLNVNFFIDREGVLNLSFSLYGSVTRTPHSLSNMQTKRMMPELGVLLKDRDLSQIIEDSTKFLDDILKDAYESKKGFEELDLDVESWVHSGVERILSVKGNQVV